MRLLVATALVCMLLSPVCGQAQGFGRGDGPDADDLPRSSEAGNNKRAEADQYESGYDEGHGNGSNDRMSRRRYDPEKDDATPAQRRGYADGYKYGWNNPRNARARLLPGVEQARKQNGKDEGFMHGREDRRQNRKYAYRPTGILHAFNDGYRLGYNEGWFSIR